MQIPAGTGGDRERDAVQVLRDREHDDPGPGIGREQSADRLDTAQARHADIHQNQIGPIGAPAAEDFLAVGAVVTRSTPGTVATARRSASRASGESSQTRTDVMTVLRS